MRVWHGLVLAALVVLTSACAPRTVPLPPPGNPTFPEFQQPLPPADLAGSPLARQNERAWQFLQAGDLRNADREASVALKAQSLFYPAQTTAAYVALARKVARAA